ncbi:MAG: hypothetical protein AAB686_03805 [Patescibacteria group bacterium]
MIKNKKLITLTVAVVLIAGFALVSAAQYTDVTPVEPPGAAGPITSPGGILVILGGIVRIIAYIFWLAAIAFTFYAAFLYLTASGNQEQIKKANSQLKWAVVAIIVGLLAFGLPNLINTFLSIGGGG